MKLEGYELPVRALAAALTHAGVKDVRYYLNGVYLDFPKGRIVATDGHRMFVGQIPKAEAEPVIVERDSADRIVKQAKKSLRDGWAIIVSVDEDNTVRLHDVNSGATFSAKAIDGKFPDYERVIPTKPDGTVGQYNLGYLADTRKALALYQGRDVDRTFPHIAHNGLGPCLVTDDSATALCVVMPVRAAGDGVAPGWYTGPVSVPEPVDNTAEAA